MYAAPFFQLLIYGLLLQVYAFFQLLIIYKFHITARKKGHRKVLFYTLCYFICMMQSEWADIFNFS
jgi:hypothetical protein